MPGLAAIRALQLAGRSPHEVGLEKEREVLTWTYAWDWTSPTIAALVGRDNQNGLASRLVRQGLLKKTRTESGGGQAGVPAYMLTLTSGGVSKVERHIEKEEQLLRYNTDPYKINQALLRHDILSQATTVKALREGSITQYWTPAQYRTKAEFGVKEPDVIWETKEGETIAVEIELSAKWGRDIDQFIGSCVRGLSQIDYEKPRFSRIAIVTDSKAIYDRYKRAFEPGAHYGYWEYFDISKRWKQTDSRQVPRWIKERMLWKLLRQP
jgi:hypothetical protein